MKYIDMHCDTLTECFDRGYSLVNCNLQTNLEKLKESRCAAQCFAVFTQGEGAALRFENYLKFFKTELADIAVTCADDVRRNISAGKTGAILTVENLGFIGSDTARIRRLAVDGVKMASLVWNYENQFAYPNLIFSDGIPQFSKREKRGLKPLGRQVIEALDANRIIVDISHLSDGGAEDILSGRKIPVVASHSNAEAVCGVSRNLTDSLIKKTAACGGVIGVNFCKDFLGEGDSRECVLRHVEHIINTGGEDVIALGSDFDGIPECEGIENCTKVPSLLEYLHASGISPRVLEKMCFGNFIRVFRTVCG